MTVTATITTVDQDFPAGTVAGLFLFEVTVSTGEQVFNGTTAGNTMDLPLTTPGTYIVSCQRQDANGVGLGGKVSAQFVIAAPATVTIAVADGITVTVA